MPAVLIAGQPDLDPIRRVDARIAPVDAPLRCARAARRRAARRGLAESDHACVPFEAAEATGTIAPGRCTTAASAAFDRCWRPPPRNRAGRPRRRPGSAPTSQCTKKTATMQQHADALRNGVFDHPGVPLGVWRRGQFGDRNGLGSHGLRPPYVCRSAARSLARLVDHEHPPNRSGHRRQPRHRLRHRRGIRRGRPPGRRHGAIGRGAGGQPHRARRRDGHGGASTRRSPRSRRSSARSRSSSPTRASPATCCCCA